MVFDSQNHYKNLQKSLKTFYCSKNKPTCKNYDFKKQEYDF